jgi:predicted phosphoribosyltransferase
MFRNRADAGRRLAQALVGYKDRPTVVLALPRGGVPVAAEVANALHAPLDLLLVRKIGVPLEPELAMGAVVDGDKPITVINEGILAISGASEAEFAVIRDRELAEIERRRQIYLGDRTRVDVAGRVAIVIDDGIATGATIRAALSATRACNPQKLVLAVPVAPHDTIASLREEADEVVCLEEHKLFDAIGLYYADFRQVSDREVIEILSRFPVPGTRPVGQPVGQRPRSRTADPVAVRTCPHAGRSNARSRSRGLWDDAQVRPSQPSMP